MDEAFLTVAEVADTLKLNQQTVRNWIDRGELPAVRLGQRRIRVRQSDLTAFIDAGSSTAEAQPVAPDGIDLQGEGWRRFRETLADANAAAADAGQAAVAVESGKWKTAGFRRACNKRLRVAFCRLADSSRHWHPWAQDLYAQARRRGHEHPRAIRTVGRAWSRVVWQCWRNHTPYDPEQHRALQRHITVIIPSSSGPMPDLAATQRMAGAAVTQKAARTGRAQST